MTQDEGRKEEEKFDFTRKGESLGYISLARARVQAMSIAQETPGDDGPDYRNVPMGFQVYRSEETEDH